MLIKIKLSWNVLCSALKRKCVELFLHFHACVIFQMRLPWGLPVLYIGKVKTVAKGARPRYILSQVMAWLENQQSGIVW